MFIMISRNKEFEYSASQLASALSKVVATNAIWLSSNSNVVVQIEMCCSKYKINIKNLQIPFFIKV